MTERSEAEKSAIRVIYMAIGHMRSFKLAPYRTHNLTDGRLLELAERVFVLLEYELGASGQPNQRRLVPSGDPGNDEPCIFDKGGLHRKHARFALRSD